LAVGNNGESLVADSSTSTGLAYKTAGVFNGLTTTGDTIYSSSGTTQARLGIGSTGQVLTVSGGVPTWATPASGSTFVGCSLFGTNGSISNATNTTLSWSGENYDTDAFHTGSGSRITIPTGKGGKYLINYGAMWEGTNSAFQNRVMFYKNGAQVKHVQYKYQVDNDVSVNVALVLELVATDYVEIVVWQNYGSNRTLYIDNTYGWFQASFLGA
jgi:hypothetical protein